MQAPALPPIALESAFVELSARAVKPPEDPIAVLNRAATPAEKLAALDSLHRSLPTAPQARRTFGLEAMRATAVSPSEDPAVRAKALTYLGYAVPVVGDETAREAAVNALLDATAGSYRVFALRGLAPATHHLPQSVETRVQETLLGLLAGTLNEDERLAALLSLDGFVRERDDLPRRRADLVLELETRMLAPIEADPAAFAVAGTANARLLTLAVIWHSARNRFASGEPVVLTRVNALLTQLSSIETDPAVRAEIAAFLAAPLPKLLP